SVEVTRSMFGIARPYVESFSIYGNKMGYEWPQLEEENSLLFTMLGDSGGMGADIKIEKLALPDDLTTLPETLWPWTRDIVLSSDEHLSVIQGGGHGGSHPHLVHEFVKSVVEGREPSISALRAGRWAAAGIAAHQSAMSGGKMMAVPSFS
ncbi:MAG: gfo/Idh/MocA family oxidoreductase, partial [Candidatus Eremiobacteraeota bacterium]|nr:gfo/Idh/MocA family oxidoreductase [Candidatus Eremiobacteraeota bacterium]